MHNLCHQLHQWANSLEAFSFPFDEKEIPRNGLYILFEKGERAHGGKRIVRIGTHTGDNQLPLRLQQHFLAENKDRSIFRKNIGRCILHKQHDPFLEQWEWDLTTRASREKRARHIDVQKRQALEREVSKYIQKNFSFAVVPVDQKNARLALESKMISTISVCEECRPSKNWLGRYSPKEKIRESGLYQVNELYKQPLSEGDFKKLERGIR
jgi:hypothetical protein